MFRQAQHERIKVVYFISVRPEPVEGNERVAKNFTTKKTPQEKRRHLFYHKKSKFIF